MFPMLMGHLPFDSSHGLMLFPKHVNPYFWQVYKSSKDVIIQSIVQIKVEIKSRQFNLQIDSCRQKHRWTRWTNKILSSAKWFHIDQQRKRIVARDCNISCSFAFMPLSLYVSRFDVFRVYALSAFARKKCIKRMRLCIHRLSFLSLSWYIENARDW